MFFYTICTCVQSEVCWSIAQAHIIGYCCWCYFLDYTWNFIDLDWIDDVGYEHLCWFILFIDELLVSDHLS